MPSVSNNFFLLDLEQVSLTTEKLTQRIQDRFPDSGLGKVCRELANISRRTRKTSLWLRRPLYSLRAISWTVSIALLGGSIWSLWLFGKGIDQMGLAEFIQVSEAAINDVVLIGAAIYFLHTIEKRIKRSRALVSIHELRSVAHIIDMHQLTKDPERLDQVKYIQTESSPQPTMNPFMLRRYLDYCSEMLSLTAKIAAIYAQDLEDSTVLSAVTEVEGMTSDLSRKIWQKIMLIHEIEVRQPGKGNSH